MWGGLSSFNNAKLPAQHGASIALKQEKALTKEAKKSQKEMEKATALGKQTGKNKLEDLNK